MRAHARLAVAADQATGRTRITRLRSDPPLVLRPTNPAGQEPPRRWNLAGPSTARASLAAAAAGPIGGDHLGLDIDVGPGAALVLRNVAATLALPGPHGQPSHSVATVRVAAGGVLVWLPGPLIAAAGCHHHAATCVALEHGARLLAREELLLGRHGEQPGTIHQHLRVTVDDRPLHHQQLTVAAEAQGWDGPAVTRGRRALGSLLVVDPDWNNHPIPDRTTTTVAADTALMPLAGPAALLTALAPDAHTLRHQLSAGLAGLE